MVPFTYIVNKIQWEYEIWEIEAFYTNNYYEVEITFRHMYKLFDYFFLRTYSNKYRLWLISDLYNFLYYFIWEDLFLYFTQFNLIKNFWLYHLPFLFYRFYLKFRFFFKHFKFLYKLIIYLWIFCFYFFKFIFLLLKILVRFIFFWFKFFYKKFNFLYINKKALDLNVWKILNILLFYYFVKNKIFSYFFLKIKKKIMVFHQIRIR